MVAMSGAAAASFVIALCLAAIAVAAALVHYLRRRGPATLRAKLVGSFIGLVGVEVALLPALLVTVYGEDLFSLAASDVDPWIVVAGYAGLTVYVIARLFPWREVEALTADPDAKLADVLRRLRDEGR